MLLRWAQTADAGGLANSAAKAYLGAVVVWLHAGDAAQAGAVYQVRNCRQRAIIAGPRRGGPTHGCMRAGLPRRGAGGWACVVRPYGLP